MDEQKLIILVGVDDSSRDDKAIELQKEIKDSVISKDFLNCQDSLMDKKTVILNMPNLARNERKEYIDLARKLKLNIQCYCFIHSFERVLVRAGGRNEDLIREQFAKISWPLPGKEVDELIVIDSEKKEHEVIGTN